MTRNWLIIAGCLLAAVALHVSVLTYQKNTIVTHRNGTITQTVAARPVFGEGTSFTIPAGDFLVDGPTPSSITIQGAYPRSFVSWEMGLIGGVILPGVLLLAAWGSLVSMTRGWLCVGTAMLTLLAAVGAGVYAYLVIMASAVTSLFSLFLGSDSVPIKAADFASDESFHIAEVTAVVLLVTSIVIAVRGWRTRKLTVARAEPA
jgi:hypothetical protein